jgi:SAM-dependent methyltransferase
VQLLREHGGMHDGVVLDPCAGAGAFLLAAARAGFRQLRGIDLDEGALKVAAQALALEGFAAKLRCADSLTSSVDEPIDLIVSNPPYGHVRATPELRRDYPALRGGEVDRYALFLLRCLRLLRPGGAMALLIPDTWMFLARSGPLRAEVLKLAEVAAAVDLGKPFAAAKDTRVQALVLQKKPALRRDTFTALAPAPREELERTAASGWCPYKTREERALCEAMEAASVPLGEACEVGYGLRTGDNARYVARRDGALRLVGGEDVQPYRLAWKPKSLRRSRELKVERQLGVPRIAVQRIRTNARAPYARWLEAAPVPPRMICLDSLSTLSSESAELLWALLAWLQSVPVQRFHRLRTTDVNVKPSALRELPVPRALIDDPTELSALARARAGCSGREGFDTIPNLGGAPDPFGDMHQLDRLIDARVYELFGLPRALVEACERGFWAERFPEEFKLLEEVVSDPSRRVARKEGTA